VKPSDKEIKLLLVHYINWKLITNCIPGVWLFVMFTCIPMDMPELAPGQSHHCLGQGGGLSNQHLQVHGQVDYLILN
jgi:hypothetical protein